MRKIALALLLSTGLVGTAAAQEDIEALTCEAFLMMDSTAQEEALDEIQAMGVSSDTAEDTEDTASDAMSSEGSAPADDSDAAMTDGDATTGELADEVPADGNTDDAAPPDPEVTPTDDTASDEQTADDAVSEDVSSGETDASDDAISDDAISAEVEDGADTTEEVPADVQSAVAACEADQQLSVQAAMELSGS